MLPASPERLQERCHGKSGSVTRGVHNVLPPRCHGRALELRGTAQGRGGFGCPPPQRPPIAPLGRELARPTVRLLQRLAGDT